MVLVNRICVGEFLNSLVDFILTATSGGHIYCPARVPRFFTKQKVSAYCEDFLFVLYRIDDIEK